MFISCNCFGAKKHSIQCQDLTVSSKKEFEQFMPRGQLQTFIKLEKKEENAFLLLKFSKKMEQSSVNDLHFCIVKISESRLSNINMNNYFLLNSLLYLTNLRNILINYTQFIYNYMQYILYIVYTLYILTNYICSTIYIQLLEKLQKGAKA